MCKDSNWCKSSLCPTAGSYLSPTEIHPLWFSGLTIKASQTGRRQDKYVVYIHSMEILHSMKFWQISMFVCSTVLQPKLQYRFNEEGTKVRNLE